jgi:hypothetical protein
MAISTTGGSGVVSGTATASVCSSITLFTTAATANTMYIVTWVGAGDDVQTIRFPTSSYSQIGPDSADYYVGGGDVIRVGPSSVVRVLLSNVSSADTYKIVYNWVGITFG